MLMGTLATSFLSPKLPRAGWVEVKKEEMGWGMWTVWVLVAAHLSCVALTVGFLGSWASCWPIAAIFLGVVWPSSQFLLPLSLHLCFQDAHVNLNVPIKICWSPFGTERYHSRFFPTKCTKQDGWSKGSACQKWSHEDMTEMNYFVA